MNLIDTDTIGDFTFATYYDDTAENPQDWYDHAAVIIAFDRRSYWKRSTLADQVPDSYVGADKINHELTNLDPDRYVDNYADDDDPESFTGFADWCADMIATFGPNTHVSFVAYEDYGSGGARVYLAGDPIPLLDTEASWRAIVDPDSGLTADGCIVVSPHTAPDTHLDADRYADIVRGDCEELTAYLSGECYGFTVTDTTTGDIVDACGGYIGGYDAVAAEARDVAQWHADQRAASFVWLRAEADHQLDVPDIAVMVAAQRTLWALDELDELLDHESVYNT